MNTRNIIICILVVAFMAVLLPHQALAGRGCTSQTDTSPAEYIKVDKNAPGTKFNATLTIDYRTNAACASSFDRDMHFFMRMEGNVLTSAQQYGGVEFLTFDGIEECVLYGPPDEAVAISAQQAALETFFEGTVNPYIYGCDPDAVEGEFMCPTSAVKSVNKVVEDDNFYPDPFYIIMDLVIAIQD